MNDTNPPAMGSNGKSVRETLKKNVLSNNVLYTDESRLYTQTAKEFTRHEKVKHTTGEY